MRTYAQLIDRAIGDLTDPVDRLATETLGNDVGVRRPDVATVASFCLRGLGAELEDGWFERIDGRLHLPAGDGGSRRRRGRPQKRASAKPTS